MSLPKIIGILGRSRSGKDTAATIIKKLHPIYTIHRFAQPIKNALQEIYDFTPEQLEDDQKELVDPRYNISPRQAMQDMTYFYLDKHGAGFFSDKLFSIFDNNKTKRIIIPDVRYEHDIHQIHKRGGIIIKIVRPSLSLQHKVVNNINELKGDYELVNDGTIKDLEDQINALFNQIV